MQTIEWFDQLSGEVLTEIRRHVSSRTKAVMDAAGFVGWDAALADLALATEPLPLTVGSVRARQPYTSPDLIATELAESAGRGILQPQERDAYRLTEDARQVLGGIRHAIEESLAGSATTAPDGFEALADVLGRHVAACVARSECDTPCLDGSRAFDPGPDAPVLLRIRRALIDLFAYRDDAHVAAWQGLGVTGHEWEALSHVWGRKVWGEPVRTLDQLAEKLAFRGYDREDYATAVAHLVELGWIDESKGQMSLTPRGIEIREAAEEATDAFFFGPWQLDDGSAARLRTQLKALLHALAEA